MAFQANKKAPLSLQKKVCWLQIFEGKKLGCLSPIINELMMANLDQANAYCLLGDIYRFGNGIQKDINMANGIKKQLKKDTQTHNVS